jgi:hypothetical protein
MPTINNTVFMIADALNELSIVCNGWKVGVTAHHRRLSIEQPG